jgi:hypothetical protein
MTAGYIVCRFFVSSTWPLTKSTSEIFSIHSRNSHPDTIDSYAGWISTISRDSPEGGSAEFDFIAVVVIRPILSLEVAADGLAGF